MLRTFQPLSRLADLERAGQLVGDWGRVSPNLVPAYEDMVASMMLQGVYTTGRPPIWAWVGEVSLLDATLLLSDHELSEGSIMIAFEAPAELIMISDYGRWNDHLAEVLSGESSPAWTPSPPTGDGPHQACVPYIDRQWVRYSRPLPTTGWDDLDLSQPL